MSMAGSARKRRSQIMLDDELYEALVREAEIEGRSVSRRAASGGFRRRPFGNWLVRGMAVRATESLSVRMWTAIYTLRRTALKSRHSGRSRTNAPHLAGHQRIVCEPG
jgi:hypothetical protein